jgi:hypothetical protein
MYIKYVQNEVNHKDGERLCGDVVVSGLASASKMSHFGLHDRSV